MATIVGGREVEASKIIFDEIVMKLSAGALERGLGVQDWAAHSRDDLNKAIARAEVVTPDKSSAQRLLDRAMLKASAIVDLHADKIFMLGSALARSPSGRLGADEIHWIVDPINPDARFGGLGPAVWATREAMAA
jgi:hypothetical protein